MSNILKLCSINQDTIPSPSKHTYTKANTLLWIFILSFLSIHHITLLSTILFFSLFPCWFDSQIMFVLEGAKTSVQAACVHFQQSKSLNCDFIFTFFPLFYCLSKFYLADRLIGWVKYKETNRKSWNQNKGTLVCATTCVLMPLGNYLGLGSSLVPLSANVKGFEKSWHALSLYALSLSSPNTGWWKWHMPIRMPCKGIKNVQVWVMTITGCSWQHVGSRT